MPSRRMVRTAPTSSTRAVDPSRLTSFIDQNYTVNNNTGTFGGTHGMTTHPEVAYDSFVSWDGLAENPAPFSRFDARSSTICAPTGPVGLAGNRVIELNEPVEGGIFAAMDKADGKRVLNVPKSDDHVAVENSHASAVGIVEPSCFRNMQLLPPTVKQVHPGSVPRKDQYLLPPSKQREMVAHELTNAKFAAMKKKTELQRRRLHGLMHDRHKEFHVDDLRPRTESSISDAKGFRGARKKNTIEARRANLRKVTDTRERHGYNPFAHGEAGKELVREYTAASHQAPYDTHCRDGYLGQPKPLRTQKLRDEDLGGKPYNIVSHIKIDHHPPKMPERTHDYRHMSHPSQHSLNRGRHTQGSLSGL